MPPSDTAKAAYVSQLNLAVPVDWLPQGSPAVVSGRAIRCGTGGILTVKTLLSGASTRTMRFADGETRLVALTAITDFGACDHIEVAV